MPVRIMLLDDHEVARSRSAERLGQHKGLHIVGATAEGMDAIALTQELRPDAVLVETRRLDQRGLETIRVLSTLPLDARPAIVAFLEILHRGDWPDAMAAGADDLVLQEMSVDGVARELRNIVSRVRDEAGQSEPTPTTDRRRFQPSGTSG